LEVLLAEVTELLADDHKGYVPPVALAPAIEAALEGSLFTKSTINAYITAVIKL
jgi:hypothetical protein